MSQARRVLLSMEDSKLKEPTSVDAKVFGKASRRNGALIAQLDETRPQGGLSHKI
jgi:hypothetical protein